MLTKILDAQLVYLYFHAILKINSVRNKSRALELLNENGGHSRCIVLIKPVMTLLSPCESFIIHMQNVNVDVQLV